MLNDLKEFEVVVKDRFGIPVKSENVKFYADSISWSHYSDDKGAMIFIIPKELNEGTLIYGSKKEFISPLPEKVVRTV